MLDPTVTERIRSIFLHDEARVTIEGAARLLGRSGGEIAAAIEDGEIETTSGCSGTVIDIRELAEQAVHVWPIDAIEEALGREAALILPAGVRTRRFTARLPRYVVAALECLAEERRRAADARAARTGVRASRAPRRVDRGVRRGNRVAVSGRDAAVETP